MATNDVIVALRTLGLAAFKSAMDDASDSVGKVGDSADKASGHVDDAGKNAGKSAGKWKSMTKGAAGAAAGIASIGAAVGFAKSATGAAVDLNEEVNKTGVVFRNSGKGLVTWSKSSADALGMSQQQALAAMGTFGNMLVPMGFARGKAAGMSKSMVGLAADMASFNNASPEDTLEALRSGLAGETEPLRKYGVFLNEGRIKAQAMSMGLVKASKDTDKIKAAQIGGEVAQRNYNKAVKEHGKNSIEARKAQGQQAAAASRLNKATAGTIPQLTASQKAQASYALMMKDSKDAQGDFQRTSGSLANQQRVLKAQWTDLSATVGKQLLPVVIQLAHALSFVMTNMQVFGPILAVLTAAMVAYKVATLLSAMATAGLSVAIFLIPLAILAVIAGLVIAYKKVGWFHDAVDAAFHALKVAVVATFNWIKNAAVNAFTWIKNAASNAINWITGAWHKITDGARSAIDGVKGLFRGVVGWFKGIGSSIVDGIVNGIKSAPSAIYNAIGSLLSALPLPGFVKNKLKGALGFHATGGIVRTPFQIVGERGPELVSLPGGSRITPLAAGGGALGAPALGGYRGAGGAQTTANFYLDRRLIATAVADDTADRKARR
jgi:hypothetical protein